MNFLWGSATSSHRIEGGNEHNDWWQWEHEGKIEGGVVSGLATDHWHRFREDLRAAAHFGMNSYRFSIEWSRLEPEEGRWDDSAMEWYRELIAECERLGLMPMATLHHFTLPRWFAQKGGFTWENAPDRFAEYVQRVARAIGARVPLWCTLNEPMTQVIGGYLASFMPPAEHDPFRASIALHNLLRSHVRAYDVLHREITERAGPWKDRPLEVGLAHNMIDFAPLRPWHPAENAMAGVFRRFYNKSWPDAVTGRRQNFGVLGVIPFAKQVPEARGRNTTDFIGVNYYMRVYVCWGPQAQATALSQDAAMLRAAALPIGITFAKQKDPTSELGWLIHPQGLGRMIRFLKRYKLPLYITENGIADRKDTQRVSYLATHLDECARAIKEGAEIRGYYHWSLLDNFEWIKGFGPRFGLLEVDYETMERTPRPSAFAYRKLIEMHQGNQPDSTVIEAWQKWVEAGGLETEKIHYGTPLHNRI